MSTSSMLVEPIEDATADASYSLARPAWLPLPMALCMCLPAASWLAGGSSLLNDASWIAMTLVCALYMIGELRVFPYRLGVGGVVLYSGVLVWFSWDYFGHWFAGAEALAGSSLSTRFTGGPDIIAKATFFHFLFITMATMGLVMRWGGRMARLIAKTPQPASPPTLLFLIVVLFLFGLLPYFLFTTVPWYEAIWDSYTSFRSDEGAGIWTVGRTGRLNISWGAYVKYWLQLGLFSGVLAAFYALYMTRWLPTQVLCWSIWVLALARAFGSGTRGQVVLVTAPILALVFMRYHTQALQYFQWFRTHRLKAYTVCFILAVMAYSLMQVQAYNRRTVLGEATLSLGQFANPKDNVMFSASLIIFELVPQQTQYFLNRFPGEGWVRPIPQTVLDFFVGAIPRALWPNKPVDQASDWVNIQMGGSRHFGSRGATISNGLVGWWWLRYGVGGVVQGGLLFGWLLCVIDRTIWLSRRKPLILVIALGLAEFMFRSFRDLRWGQLYQFLIGLVVLWLLSLFVKRRSLDEPPLPYD